MDSTTPLFSKITMHVSEPGYLTTLTSQLIHTTMLTLEMKLRALSVDIPSIEAISMELTAHPLEMYMTPSAVRIVARLDVEIRNDQADPK